MQFTLHTGLFDHHTYYCKVIGDAVILRRVYSSFPPERLVRKIRKNNTFRLNKRIFRIPENPGDYGFYDLLVEG